MGYTDLQIQLLAAKIHLICYQLNPIIETSQGRHLILDLFAMDCRDPIDEIYLLSTELLFSQKEIAT